MSATGCFIWAARSAAALGLLLGPSCLALPQQAQQPGPPSLPQAPLPQSQLAQPAIPGLPAPPAVLSGLTWDQVKAKFEAANPALKADEANVDEMKAEEITAFLRPNPQFTHDARMEPQIAPHDGVWQPLPGHRPVAPNFSYLHERDHKRELRLESAKEGTQITDIAA